MKRSIIIYLPTGAQLKYATVDLGDSKVFQALEILPLTALQSVQVVETDGARVTFTGIPYQLDEWE